MSTRTITQNLNSGLLAGSIATVIYVAISSFFYGGWSQPIIKTGVTIGLITLAITFTISRIISIQKGRQR